MDVLLVKSQNVIASEAKQSGCRLKCSLLEIASPIIRGKFSLRSLQ